ncbi:MAG: polysaccharide deacetylase family protein [Fimbriimonadaceae bacterium]
MLAALLFSVIAAGQPPFTPIHRVFHGSKTNEATLDKDNAYWKNAQIEVYKSAEELQAQEERELRSGKPLTTLRHGPLNKKEIALTFDDGPHEFFTPKLLTLLDQYHVKATFFVIGKMVDANPNLLKQIHTHGHLIGNHTFSHVTLTKLPFDEILTEYRATNDVIRATIGITPKYCRPPGGDHDSATTQAAQYLGLQTTLWTDDPGDYANPGDGIILSRLYKRLGNGGIILLHDGPTETLEILKTFIPACKNKGYTFVTLDKWQK